MTDYNFHGIPVVIRNKNVYNANNNKWLGHFCETTDGIKHVIGAYYKGILTKNN